MRRGAFTMLEAVLATVVASLVLTAAWSLLAALERSEQSVRRRAHQIEQLQRTRLVMERAFGSILVAQPAPARRPVTAVATPVDESAGGQEAAGDRPGAQREAGAARRRFSSGATGGKDGGREGDSGSLSSASRDTPSQTRPTGTQSPSGAQVPDDTPPRIILHEDDWLVSTPMTIRDESGGEAIVTPQRLEMVLVEPPVPTSQADPFVLAKAVKLEAKRRGYSRKPTGETDQGDASPTDDESGTQTQHPDWGVRAVRGAFELVPKVGRDGRTVLDDFGHPKAWELWWVPQTPRRTLSEVREMGRARAMLEAASFGEPYLIATDLASVRWRMYRERQRREEYQATIQNQLPAYVEMDIATTGGMSASWIFEVSWATGVEVLPKRDDGPGGAGSSSQASQDAVGGPKGGAK